MAQPLASAPSEVEATGTPDLGLLDFDLPDVSGFDGLTRLRRAARGAPILVVPSMAEPRVAGNAI